MTARTFEGLPLTPGVNVDRIKVTAGVAEAAAIGYGSPTEQMAVTYALQRWARGEEHGALRTFMTDGRIDLTSAYRIIAAARAGGVGDGCC